MSRYRDQDPVMPRPSGTYPPSEAILAEPVPDEVQRGQLREVCERTMADACDEV